MLRSILPSVVILLLASSAAAQRARLPIADLVTSPTKSPGAALWIEHLSVYVEAWGETSGIGFAGERALLDRPSPQRLLSPNELAALVATLADVDEGSIEVDEQALSVPRADEPAVNEALAWLRARVPPLVDLDLQLERIADDGTTVLLRSRERVRPDSITTLADVVKRPILRDFDVEIAQAAATANPIVDTIAIGACLALRARVVPGGDSVLLEAVARVAEAAEGAPIDTNHEGFGDLDRAARAIDDCGVSFVVPRGGTVVQEWLGRGGRLRLTCSARWTPIPDDARNEVVVRFGSLLREPPLGFRDAVDRGGDFGDAPDPVPFVEATLRRADRGDLLVVEDGTSGAKIALAGPRAAELDRQIVTALARSLAPVRLEIGAYDVPAGTDIGAAEPTGGTRLARISGAALAGRTCSFAARTEFSYLREWDVEVAQSARIPDPKTDRLAFGVRFDLEPIAAADGRIEALALDATFGHLERIEVADTRISLELRAGGTVDPSGSIQPAIVLPADVVRIEKPVMRNHRVASTLHLDEDGRAVLRRAAPRLLGAGRELVIVVRVTGE